MTQMSIADSLARKLVTKGYYMPGFDHLIVYTNQAAEVLDDYYKNKETMCKSWSPSVLWGGYIRSLDPDNKKVFVLISTANPGVTFRKIRFQLRISNCYLDIVQIFTRGEYPGIELGDKKVMFDQLLTKIPEENRLNKFRKYNGQKQKIDDMKKLSYHAETLVKIGE